MSFRQADTPTIAAAKASNKIHGSPLAEESAARPPQAGSAGCGLGQRGGAFAEERAGPAASRPVAIFDEIRRRHPEIGVGIRRTLERRIRSWRALNARNRKRLELERPALQSLPSRRTTGKSSLMFINPTRPGLVL